MDYVLIAVVVFLSSFVGASLGARGDGKPKNIVTRVADMANEKVDTILHKDDIFTEISAIQEWFNGKAGGNEDE